jgi:hypothetical protein
MIKFYPKKPEINDNSQNQKTGKKKDIYTDTPVRYLGFTNEAGAALAPLMGPVGEMYTYAPALGYIAMDVRDKYKRGDDDEYQKTSGKRATKQLVFQLLASVILPTAAVKTGQIIAGKSIDKMPKLKDSVKEFVTKRPSLQKFVHRFRDKSAAEESNLMKFAHGFQKVIDTITIIPRFIKAPENKSGLRNIGLALAGFTALGLAIKPIDHFVESIVVEKGVDPLLYKERRKNKIVEA